MLFRSSLSLCARVFFFFFFAITTPDTLTFHRSTGDLKENRNYNQVPYPLLFGRRRGPGTRRRAASAAPTQSRRETLFTRQIRCSREVADLGLFVPARRRRRRAAPHHRKKVVISLAQKPERRISGASPTYLRKPAPALEKTTARRRQAPRTQSPQKIGRAHV